MLRKMLSGRGTPHLVLARYSFWTSARKTLARDYHRGGAEMKKRAQRVTLAPSTSAFQRSGSSAAFASVASSQAVSCKDPLATKQVRVNRDKQKCLF